MLIIHCTDNYKILTKGSTFFAIVGFIACKIKINTKTVIHVCQRSVQIKFRLKFFNLGWFSICFVCLLALISHESELGDKAN